MDYNNSENALSTAAEYIELGQKMARLLYGRDIRHVMLLHLGGEVLLPRRGRLSFYRHIRSLDVPPQFQLVSENGMIRKRICGES